MKTLAPLICFAAVAASAACAQALQPGVNSVLLRGKPQDVYLYPSEARLRGSILFLPGDGGWRGFAVDMARNLASAGYNVYGWDIKRYLMSFTDGRKALTETEMAADIGAMAQTLVVPAGRERMILAGWSQGAAMAALAAAHPANHRSISGVIALGLPESGVLGWRRTDDLTYITRRDPDEPTFAVAPLLDKIAPLPIAVIQSSSDEYVPAETARRLIALARDPKRFTMITAKNHRYDGNQDEFFRTLCESAVWIQESGR